VESRCFSVEQLMKQALSWIGSSASFSGVVSGYVALLDEHDSNERSGTEGWRW
jgi:hypothetical protein